MWIFELNYDGNFSKFMMGLCVDLWGEVKQTITMLQHYVDKSSYKCTLHLYGGANPQINS